VRRGRLEQHALDRLGLLTARTPSQPSEVWIDGLDDALAELAPELQQAIELRVVDDLPYAEIAAATGTTEGAARVRVHRGLNALRQRLLSTTEVSR
jgi:DNA-directed RNA polymerase specialized sigma24 family protein